LVTSPFTSWSSSTSVSPRTAKTDSIPPPPFGLTELEPEFVPPEHTYRKDESLAYVEHCRKKHDAAMAGITGAWNASPCPSDYRAMSNGELLLYNMRHVQPISTELHGAASV
jgi:hypothetical protein